MNKIILIISILFSATLFAVEPDESGIGGTGVSKPDVREFIFNRPDVPDIAPDISPDIIDIPNLREIGPADLIGIPASTESNIDVPSDITAPTTPTEK